MSRTAAFVLLLSSCTAASAQDAPDPRCAEAHFAYGRALEASRLCGTPQPSFRVGDPDCPPAVGGSLESRIESRGKASLDRATIAGPRGGIRRFCAAITDGRVP